MNRSQLSQEISKNTGLSSQEAENLVISFGSVVADVLSRGEKVVYSNFGTFYTVHYPSKVIFHPSGNGQKLVMLPTNAVKWMPSSNIKQMVVTQNVIDSPTLHKKRRDNLASILNQQSPPQDKQFNDNIIDDQYKNRPSENSKLYEVPITVKQESVTSNQNAKIATPKYFDADSGVFGKKTDNLKIYEENLSDGGKIESTFSDAIRVPNREKQTIWDRLFKKRIEEPKPINKIKVPNLAHTSHVGVGLFDNITKNPGLNKINNTIDKKSPKAIDFSAKQSDSEKINNANIELSSEKPFEKPATNSPQVATSDTHEPAKIMDIAPFQTKTDISYVDLSKASITKELLHKIPEKVARKYKIVPIEDQIDKLVVAMIDPEDVEAIEIAKKVAGKNIAVRLATEDDINNVLDQYAGLENELEEAIEIADEEADTEKKKQSSVDKGILIESASDNAPAARIVNSLLKRAIREKASDVHIEPTEKELEVRYRIDGILHKKADLPKDVQSAVITRLKILCNMKIDEQRLPQDGRFSINFDDRKIDFRVSSLPVANGEKIVMRILDKATGILTVEQLGLRGAGLSALQENLEKSHGMILVTGPTGSGKTTTLYAVIDKLFAEGVNIVTLEDPIEYKMPGINQSQVNSEIDYTFAAGLRSIVRQDPDIIMIGEIRDPETAEMAVHAALTGHIVLSTLHTNNSAGAAPRLTDMKVEPFLLTSSLNCVVGQRLARKVCESCKDAYVPSKEELEEVKKIVETMPPQSKEEAHKKELKFIKGKGCKNCGNTGYKGRIGLFEVLKTTEEINQMILTKQSSVEIEAAAVKNGMITMVQDGILKALDGLVTLEEVWRTTRE